MKLWNQFRFSFPFGVPCGNGLSESLQLSQKRRQTDRCGSARATPDKWNRLPLFVRPQQTIWSFRSQLKTCLFRLAYPLPKSSLPGSCRCLVGYDLCLALDCPFLDYGKSDALINFALC